MKCIWCDRDATLLCDAIIGRDSATAYVDIRTNDDAITCDAPVCEIHCIKVGHICGDGRCDTIDYCLAHVTDDQRIFRRMTIAQAALYRTKMAAMAKCGPPVGLDDLIFKSVIGGDVIQMMRRS